MQKKYNLPFVSANIFQPDGKTLLFQPYIIKTLKGFTDDGKQIPDLRVGILGLVFKRLQIVIDKDEPQLIVSDPIEAAKKTVAEMKGKCDVIIALAHIRYPQLRQLAENVPEIDVIIGCHDPIYREKFETYGKAIAIIGGNRGQYIGDLKLNFDKNKNIIHHSGIVAKLDKNINNDPDMMKLIGEFKRLKSKSIRKKTKK